MSYCTEQQIRHRLIDCHWQYKEKCAVTRVVIGGGNECTVEVFGASCPHAH